MYDILFAILSMQYMGLTLNNSLYKETKTDLQKWRKLEISLCGTMFARYPHHITNALCQLMVFQNRRRGLMATVSIHGD